MSAARGQITVYFVYPPIPIRQFDYNANRDPESHQQGWGANPDEAVLDLLAQEWADTAEDDRTPYECSCGARFEEPGSVLCCMENGHK